MAYPLHSCVVCKVVLATLLILHGGVASAQAPAAQTPAPQTPAPQTPAPQTPAAQTPAPQTPDTADHPLSIDLTAEEQHLEIARTLLKEVYPKQSPAEFTKTCDALIKAFRNGVIECDKLQTSRQDDDIAAVTAMVKKVRKEIGDAIWDNAGPARNAWKVQHNKISKQINANHTKASQWKAGYLSAIKLLELVKDHGPNVLATDPTTPDGKIAANVKTAFENTAFSNQVYETLLKLDVVRLDDSFPQTCKKLAAAIEKQLTTADAALFTDATQFQNSMIAAILLVLDTQTKGDPDAKKAWGAALQEFLFRLQTSQAGGGFNVNSIPHWRHAYSQLKSGLLQAPEDDKKYIAELQKNRTGGGATTGSQESAGSYLYGPPHHARKMGRIERTHVRRLSRIEYHYGR